MPGEPGVIEVGQSAARHATPAVTARMEAQVPVVPCQSRLGIDATGEEVPEDARWPRHQVVFLTHSSDIPGLGGIATQQPMLTESPDIAGLRPRLLRGLERLVKVERLGALPFLPGFERAEEVPELIVAEAREADVDALLEVTEQTGE